jgi:hypothetical protein
VSRIRLTAAVLLVPLALCLIPDPAAGEDGSTAYLFGLDSSQFPQVSAYLSVSDPLGGRVAGLAAGDVTLKEDSIAARGVILSEGQTGVRVVAVMDPGLDMIYALPDGETRIDRIRRTMTDWLAGLPQGGIDDLTLVTPQGTSVSHTSDPQLFLDGLRSYEPKLPADRTLDAMLVDALGAAADPLPRPGMRSQLIVFSASQLSEHEGIGRGLCPRARELHATFFGIWSGRVEPSTKPDREELAALAAECGGFSVALESAPGTAALLAMIATQRDQYRVEYRSAASLSGEHSISAEIVHGSFQVQTAPLPFQIDVRPPAAAWIDFPERVSRAGDEISQPVEEYQPAGIDLPVDITFPDGHPREIVSMQLFADFELVGECAALPCGELHWDLRRYHESGRIMLQVVVRDELGLEGTTARRPVQVDVMRPTYWEIFQAYYLLPSVLLLAGAAAAGFVIAAIVNMNRMRAAQAAGDLLFPDGRVGRAAQVAAWRNRVAEILRRRRAPPATPEENYAVLETLTGEARPIAIGAKDVIIGRDPQAAAVVLSDPSVSPRHARIVRMGDGTPWVFDLGSVAGTWRNFEEVPPEGAALREGDRLNFGRAAFRVRLKPCVDAEDILNES